MIFCNHAFAFAVLAVGVSAVFQQTKGKLSQRARDVTLPDVSEVLANPKNVLGKMSSSIEQLKRNMADIQIRNAEAVLAEKKTYERQLYQQKQVTIALQNSIDTLETRVADLKTNNREARRHAEDMRKKSQELLNDAHAMQANFTSAFEVVDSLIAEAKANITNPPELAVVNEVDKDHEKEARESRLDAIARIKPLSFLQTGDARSPGQSHEDAKGLVKSLLSSLGSLNEEHNASSKSLKVAFDREYADGEANLAGMRKKEARLNATLAAEEELWQRLHAADEHATKAFEQLQAQALAVRTFAKQLGYRRMPAEAPPAKAKDTPAQPVVEEKACEDRNEQCYSWAKIGECSKNAEWMSDNCQISCGVCGDTADSAPAQPVVEEKACEDKDEHCYSWAKVGECSKNAEWMSDNCQISCGVCVGTADSAPAQPVVELVEHEPPEYIPAQPAVEENAENTLAQPAVEEHAENTSAAPVVEGNEEDTSAELTVEEKAENTPAQLTVEENGENTPSEPTVEKQQETTPSELAYARMFMAESTEHETNNSGVLELAEKREKNSVHKKKRKHHKRHKHTDKSESAKDETAEVSKDVKIESSKVQKELSKVEKKKKSSKAEKTEKDSNQAEKKDSNNAEKKSSKADKKANHHKHKGKKSSADKAKL